MRCDEQHVWQKWHRFRLCRRNNHSSTVASPSIEAGARKNTYISKIIHRPRQWSRVGRGKKLCQTGGFCDTCIIFLCLYVSCHCVWVKVVSHYNQDGLSPNPGEILRMFCPRIHVWGCLFYVFFCANGLTSDWVLFSAGLPIGHCWCGLFRERAFFLHLMVKVMSLLFSGTARCFCCSENTRSCCWWSGRQCSGSCDSTCLCAHAAFPAACLHCVTEENKRPLRDFQH